MFGLLSTIARAIDVALLQPIAGIIETIAAAVYYFLAVSWFIGYCLVQCAGFIWRLLCDGVELATIVYGECRAFYEQLRNIICDVYDYIYHGTGDGLLLADNITRGIGLLVSNLLIELGNLTLWLLALLPRAVIFMLDSLILLLEHLGNYLLGIAAFLLLNLFRMSIGIAVLLVIYMFRRYVYLCLLLLLRKLHFQMSQTCSWMWNYVDRKCSWLLQKLHVNEAQNPSTNSPSSRSDCCVVCIERSRNIVLLPCRHLCLCKECSQQLHYYEGGNRCPVCRDFVETMLAIYS
ncbi:hypothetical protein KR093_011179 [Drosophila rubida]|uniref:RING-type domain-containing protein n=1 Tax=Drosophila rubida TaxID=30044 RepID=A0AAD4PPT0_9MUSC|nr:hypothetical protein KR093_011179 [Drosophila rubida]